MSPPRYMGSRVIYKHIQSIPLHRPGLESLCAAFALLQEVCGEKPTNTNSSTVVLPAASFELSQISEVKKRKCLSV